MVLYIYLGMYIDKLTGHVCLAEEHGYEKGFSILHSSRDSEKRGSNRG
jgi:hypothetical protein